MTDDAQPPAASQRPYYGHEHWPLYKSHKVVRAVPIVQIEESIDGARRKIIWVQAEGCDREPFMPTKPQMEDEAKVGAWALCYEDGFRSIHPSSFLKDYDLLGDPAVNTRQVPLLASKENPGGWEIEALMRRLKTELMAKGVALQAVSGKHPSVTAAKAMNNRMLVGVNSILGWFDKGHELASGL